MFVRSEAQDHVTDEYGGRFRRLYPWEGVASPPSGPFTSLGPTLRVNAQTSEIPPGSSAPRAV
jgi:hypothetical protein